MFQFINPDFSFININITLYEANGNEGTFCPKYSVRASEVCSSTQLIFSHSLKQTIILTFDKLCINLIEFN
jgi:hypothetical protein